MVTPRLGFISAFDRALTRQQARVGGLVQRGVVVAVNDLFSPAICTVQVDLRNGDTARVPNVQVLSTSYDPASPPSTPQVGQRVLLLCPTGRAPELCFVLGLASSAQYFFTNLANAASTRVRISTTRLLTANLTFTPPMNATVLVIRGVEVATGGGTNVEPTLVVGGSVTFRATRSFEALIPPSITLGSGWGLPKIVLGGTYRAGVQAGVPQTVNLSFHGQAVSALDDWEYQLYSTISAAQEPNPTDAGVAFAGVGPYPLLTLFGNYETT